MMINGRCYLLLERLSGGDREKFHAVCPEAGPGAFRLVHVLARTRSAIQLLSVMKRTELGKYNFPEIIEWHEQADRVILVTSWIWGESLLNRLVRARARPKLWPHPWVAFRLFRGLAHSLHYLNNRLNIVHGDLHPGNLMLVRDSNRLIVTDFGSSWIVEGASRRLAGDGRVDGFASPEQHLGLRQVDFRSDLFSASAIAYLLITGQLPYAQLGGKAGAPHLREVFATRWANPSGLCARPDQVPRDIWKLIDSALHRGLNLDPLRRFSSTHVWLDELNEIDARFRIRPPMGLVSRMFLKLIQLWSGSHRD